MPPRAAHALLLALLGAAACSGHGPARTQGASPPTLPMVAPLHSGGSSLQTPTVPASRSASASVPAPTSESAPVPASASAAAPPAPPPAPRLYSQGYTTWIYGRPKADKRYIGYIRNGASVALRSTELVRGEACPKGFYPIEPRGFVCNDATVTREPSPLARAAADATAAAPGPFPYRYAISNGAPMYNRVPTPEEQARFERRYGPAGKWIPLPKVLSAHEDLATAEPITPADAIPPFLTSGGPTAEGRLGLVRESIPLGSMLSFTKAFSADGRTFLFSADQTLVPAERMRPFRPSAFHGTPLGEGIDLPIAWMRKTARPKYRLPAAGEIAKSDLTWPARAFVALTGKSLDVKGERYLETREEDADGRPFYIAERDATVVEALKKTPIGVKPGQKFIIIHISQGTLVAYDGLKPVYATLMSPGAGGVPQKGKDPVKHSTTPLGTYYVTFKDRAATMSPDKEGEPRTLWIADVPHTQYFNPPFAIHAAYWHERFGEPTSAGCVNVSPIDAEALFRWSDPPVPDEWQGATGAGAPENGATTAVVVRR